MMDVRQTTEHGRSVSAAFRVRQESQNFSGLLRAAGPGLFVYGENEEGTLNLH